MSSLEGCSEIPTAFQTHVLAIEYLICISGKQLMGVEIMMEGFL